MPVKHVHSTNPYNRCVLCNGARWAYLGSCSLQALEKQVHNAGNQPPLQMIPGDKRSDTNHHALLGHPIDVKEGALAYLYSLVHAQMGHTKVIY